MSTYTPVASVTLTSAVSSLTFAGVPQNYTDLILVYNVGASSAANVQVQLNNDTRALYSTVTLYGTGSGSGATGGYANNTIMYPGVAAALPSTISANAILQFNSYSNATTFKTMLSRYNNAASEVDATISTWRNTSAITSIQLSSYSGNWLSGSTFNLYGIASGSAKATGGLVTNDGTYYYHTFLQSGIFTPNQALTVDYLVVAGGGGGGCNTGAGGGAGGLRSSVTATGGGGSPESSLSLVADNYSIVIGAGGAGNSSGTDGVGVSGNNSIFSTITSTGGGYGGANVAGICIGGGNGGSGGGGGGGNSGTGPAGTRTASPVQGNNGGVGFGGGNQSGAGGGGANGTGGTASNAVGGAGGSGLQLTAFSSATSTGVSGYYAGGGGGASYNGTVGSGGAGGGGAGGLNSGFTPVAGVSGTPNTGSGGGGGSTFSGFGGNGGSGIVIVRYAI